MAASLWISKDGRAIPIDEMDDAHLEHTIAFLIRVLKVNPKRRAVGVNRDPQDWLLRMVVERHRRRNGNTTHGEPSPD